MCALLVFSSARATRGETQLLIIPPKNSLSHRRGKKKKQNAQLHDLDHKRERERKEEKNADAIKPKDGNLPQEEYPPKKKPVTFHDNDNNKDEDDNKAGVRREKEKEEGGGGKQRTLIRTCLTTTTISSSSSSTRTLNNKLGNKSCHQVKRKDGVEPITQPPLPRS